MPKFNGRNKKRINPRYFLNETIDFSTLSDEELQHAQTARRFNMDSPEGQAIADEMTKRFQKHFKEQTPETGWALDKPSIPDEEFSDPDSDADDAAELMDMLDDQTRADLIDSIRGYSKDISGHRRTWGDWDELDTMTDDDLRSRMRDMSNSSEAEDFRNSFRDEEEASMGRDIDTPPEEKMPKQQGFGHRPGAKRPWPKRS